MSYVFVHLLPALAKGHGAVNRAAPAGLRWLEHHNYLTAMVGLAVLNGLERAAQTARRLRSQG